MRFLWARQHSTGMRHSVFKRVRPSRASSRHTTIIIKSITFQSLEHGISTNLQERRSHTLNICRLDSGKSDSHFSHANDFISPFNLVKALAIRMSHGMRGNLVAIGVHVLDLAVVGPFVGDVEGALDGAPVGVPPFVSEEIFEELLIETVDGVVEGEEHELRNVLACVTSGYFRASTVAIGQSTIAGVTSLCSLLTTNQA